MKYRFEHEFPCDRDTLMRTMYQQGITEVLKPRMATVQEVETKSWSEAGGRITRKVRYMPVPKIHSVGPKKVEPRWMEWIEESELDLKTGTARYTNVPTTHKVAELLKNHGTVEFVSAGPHRTKRVLSGELKVEVFLLGKVAEVVIQGYAKEIVDEEAAALARHIAETAARK
jgi:hypothetical protein